MSMQLSYSHNEWAKEQKTIRFFGRPEDYPKKDGHMTKKDYNRAVDIIAGEVKRLVDTEAYGPVQCRLVASSLTEAFIQLFTAENARFDKQRFTVAVEDKLDTIL